MKKAAGWIILSIGVCCLVFLAGLFIGRNTVSKPKQERSTATVSIASANTSEDQRININTADSQILQTLPGIGEVLADRIVAYREEHGPFQEVRELQNVEGIGPNKMMDIMDLVCVEETK